MNTKKYNHEIQKLGSILYFLLKPILMFLFSLMLLFSHYNLVYCQSNENSGQEGPLKF